MLVFFSLIFLNFLKQSITHCFSDFKVHYNHEDILLKCVYMLAMDLYFHISNRLHVTFGVKEIQIHFTKPLPLAVD